MSFLASYGLFLLKVITLLVAVVLVVVFIAGIKRSGNTKNEGFKVSSLNFYYEQLREQLLAEVLDKKGWKALEKERKAKEKEKDKGLAEEKPRLFVLDFEGDIEASAVGALREQVSALLQVADVKDKVLLRLESAGGYVHSYGLAASQLVRLRDKGLSLVVAVDKVAASGGYMMACVGSEILAAPFAIVGSVGVIGAVPNFNALLEKHHVQYEEHTAGKHKRSLTMFGKNDDEDRAQFKRELLQTHDLFKRHIQVMRPQVSVDEIATGETWYGQEAVQNALVDKVMTSDDFLLAHLATHEILLLSEERSESFLERLRERFLGRLQAVRPFKSWIV